ncbi:MAG TPA: response regulator [Verrucomicrobiae bacterium]|nr:response regulator [Verrucomicrobiae bacterium]
MNNPATTTRRKILVVDDDPLVCDSIKRLLEVDGHIAETATSGQEALALFNSGTFDLVIIDYAMPDMKGDELALRIKALAPNQPILMITAHVEELLSSGNPLAGVDLVVGKPFDSKGLRKALSNLIKSHNKSAI